MNRTSRNIILGVTLVLVSTSVLERLVRNGVIPEWIVGHDGEAKLAPLEMPSIPGAALGSMHITAKTEGGGFKSFPPFRLSRTGVITGYYDLHGTEVTKLPFTISFRLSEWGLISSERFSERLWSQPLAENPSVQVGKASPADSATGLPLPGDVTFSPEEVRKLVISKYGSDPIPARTPESGK